MESVLKENKLKKINGNAKDFFDLLLSLRGISKLDEKIVLLLNELHHGEYSANLQKFLYIFFSLCGDGNTQISLTPEILLKKWNEKWTGLVIQATNHRTSNETENDFPDADDFKVIIENGCKEILENKNNINPLVVEYQDNQPFLYAEKNLTAKKNIEKCFSKNADTPVFINGSKPADTEIDACINENQKIIKPENQETFKLNREQAEAIIRGQNQNLIITGGPGTGKTTVVFFLLWNLLKRNEKMLNWNFYFAAPSGKAGKRLEESIADSIEMLNKETQNSKEVKKLSSIKGDTLHKLLKFNPSNSAFTFNKNNNFPENSVFVIDEASMIDLSLFAAFMTALPKRNFKLFILGDKDQLPSVESGAVLGELLEIKRDCVVKLITSNRFNDSSKIGKLAQFIQNPDKSSLEKIGLSFKTWDNKNLIWKGESDEIHLLQLAIKNTIFFKRKEEETETLQKLMVTWVKKSYENENVSLSKLAEKINPSYSEDLVNKGIISEAQWKEEETNRNNLWNLAENSKILSAERHSVRGVINLNQLVIQAFKKNASEPFDGCLKIITKNLSFFNLFNGDSGIVVNCKETPTLMLKKEDSFIFYPLHTIPEECIENAFAITVHKSQGSGYPNIMMFLPNAKGHPLLNRQILYTGITRTKKESLTIVAEQETFDDAIQKIIQRDTGIKITE